MRAGRSPSVTGTRSVGGYGSAGAFLVLFVGSTADAYGAHDHGFSQDRKSPGDGDDFTLAGDNQALEPTLAGYGAQVGGWDLE